MTKISDIQAIILSAAAQREDRIALPLPESLRGGGAAKVVGAMLAKGFLEEVDADMRKGEPVWRETSDGHGVTLVAMLRAPDGATIEEIMAVTGWQSHTVRGAMAGALKKKLGLEVTSEKVENRGRVYKLPTA
ncbi:MAG: DUF3489 domain-containing protein [Rhodobacteraceae bacterium]|nr:DUF3489 domain-containing protein [Paracoccaceae bacterium]